MRVALLYGGRSVEHVVSTRSAAQILKQLNQSSYEVIPIAISRQGQWSVQNDARASMEALPATFNANHEVTIRPARGLYCNNKSLNVDICFPVCHGSEGEDGMLQGLLELAHLPYVGCNAPTSALCMNKHQAKLSAQSAGVPVLDSLLMRSSETPNIELIHHQLGSSLIVKPNDGGSSVGVTALPESNQSSLEAALKHCYRFSCLALIEPLVAPCWEIECALVSTDTGLCVSEPGLVINPQLQGNSFLTYEQKYLGHNTAYIHVPAPLEASLAQRIQKYALLVGNALDVHGYARVDFLYQPHNKELYFNEINTLPGMTEKSHFPVLAMSMGYSWQTLVQLLIEQGLVKASQRQALEYRDVE
ncbi:MAG: D-alanine--D-alanine ligase [Sphaerochaetaceae bacterium]